MRSAAPRRNVRPPIPVAGAADRSPVASPRPARPPIARPPIARPPIPMPGAADRSPVASPRPTVKRRAMVRPHLWTAPGGYPARHEYVRRYWTAALGPGAVADLLRLVQAAKRRRSIRRPLSLATLARVGLVVEQESRLYVRSTVPPVPPELWPRLTPQLRRELT